MLVQGMRRSERTDVMVTAGNLKKKNWFKPGIKMDQKMPMTHARRVEQGISKSSVLATAERTSGYGESSSMRCVSGRHRPWHALQLTYGSGIWVTIGIIELGDGHRRLLVLRL